MKSFGSKKFKLHAGVKKCHFGNFSERAENRDGRALLVWPSRIPCWISKILFALGSYEFLAKLERVYSFRDDMRAFHITITCNNRVASDSILIYSRP